MMNIQIMFQKPLEILMNLENKGQPQQGGQTNNPGQQGQQPGQQTQQQPSEKPGQGSDKS
jgi:hypothetical protein